MASKSNKKSVVEVKNVNEKDSCCGGKCSCGDNSGDRCKPSGAGLMVPAGVLLGLGAGFAFGNVPAGLFIGIGAGFLVFALLKIFRH